VLPPTKASDPPEIVPPARVHEPVEAFSVIVEPVLLMVPVRMLTVPPALVQVPMPAVTLNVVLWRLSVAPEPTATVPGLLCVEALIVVMPVVADSVALLVNVVDEIESVCPVA
jgi:hypothetical protein